MAGAAGGADQEAKAEACGSIRSGSRDDSAHQTYDTR